jgi:hypothetical protein
MVRTRRVSGATAAGRPRRHVLRGPGYFKRMIVLEVTVPYHRYARVLRWLAVPVLAGSTAYAIAETAGWREGLGRRVKQARAFYEVIAAGLLSQPLVGAAAVVMAALSVLAALSALAVLP